MNGAGRAAELPCGCLLPDLDVGRHMRPDLRPLHTLRCHRLIAVAAAAGPDPANGPHPGTARPNSGDAAAHHGTARPYPRNAGAHHGTASTYPGDAGAHHGTAGTHTGDAGTHHSTTGTYPGSDAAVASDAGPVTAAAERR